MINGADYWERSNQFVRHDVAKLYRGRCAYCGRRRSRPGELTCDHVVPVADGGSTWEDNLVPACRRCNNFKGYKSIPEFRQAIANVLLLHSYGVQQNTDRVTWAQHFDVSDRVRFWFERCPPTRTDAPVLLALQRIVLAEDREQAWWRRGR